MLADMLTPEQLIATLRALGDAAPCLWPIAVVTLAFLFKSEVRDLIGRLRRGKVFGTEIELGEKVAHVQANIAEAVADVATSADTQTPIVSPQATVNEPRLLTLAQRREILIEASTSPVSAYLRVLSEVDRRLSDVAKILTGSKTSEVLAPAEAMRLLDSLDPEELTPAGQAAVSHVRGALQVYSPSREEWVTAAARDPAIARGSLGSALLLLDSLDSLPPLVAARARRKPQGSEG